MWTPPVLLGLIVVFGIGFAFNGPASKAVIDDLVPDAQLSAAVALNGVVINVGRAAGPALAGVLIAGVGPGAVFGVNALSFIGALIVLARWRRPQAEPLGPPERMTEAVASGVRFVRFTPEVTTVLVRTAAFIGCGSALWAMVPIIAKEQLSLDSTGYGVLLAFFGIGTVAWTGVRERVEEHVSIEWIVVAATVLFAATMGALAVVRSLGALYLTMAVAGVAWIALLTSFNVATQTALPGWVRARGGARTRPRGIPDGVHARDGPRRCRVGCGRPAVGRADSAPARCSGRARRPGHTRALADAGPVIGRSGRGGRPGS